MRHRHLAMFAGFITLYSSSALADPTITIATGGEKGSYHHMEQNLVDTCKLPIEEKLSAGSNQNIEWATRNQTHAFFTQTDALFMYDGTIRKLDNMKTIAALHREDLHFLSPVQSKMGKKGFTSFGKMDFESVRDLAGYPVGVTAGSGSEVTANFLSDKLGSPSHPFFEVRTYKNEEALKNAALQGEVASALLVGGQPLESVEKTFGPQFKLLRVPDEFTNKLSKYYDSDKLSYATMGAKGTPTIATRALLVGRVLHDKDKVDTFAKLRQCINDNLGQLQDDGWPTWADITNPEDHGRWTWMELPSVQPAAATADAPARKRRK